MVAIAPRRIAPRALRDVDRVRKRADVGHLGARVVEASGSDAGFTRRARGAGFAPSDLLQDGPVLIRLRPAPARSLDYFSGHSLAPTSTRARGASRSRRGSVPCGCTIQKQISIWLIHEHGREGGQPGVRVGGGQPPDRRLAAVAGAVFDDPVDSASQRVGLDLRHLIEEPAERDDPVVCSMQSNRLAWFTPQTARFARVPPRRYSKFDQSRRSAPEPPWHGGGRALAAGSSHPR